MTETLAKEIVVVGEEVQLGTLSVSGPSEVIKRASAVARELANVINDRKLYKVINGRKFVQVEGWSTLGAMLGILPRERQVAKFEGGWEAYVELVRASDGVIIGGASAICTRDEKNWGKRDEYAVRSMAITRATGKAFRLGFSWIMTLAGYEVTPAEEMPDEPAREWDAKTVKAGEDSGKAPSATATNPDPVPEEMRKNWDALCKRADAVKVPWEPLDWDTVVKPDFIAVFNELTRYVRDAERQAKSTGA